MDDEDLTQLLRSWDMPDVIIQRFQQNKIKKRHLGKISDSTIQKLIPEEGLRMDFEENLMSFKSTQETAATIVPHNMNSSADDIEINLNDSTASTSNERSAVNVIRTEGQLILSAPQDIAPEDIITVLPENSTLSQPAWKKRCVAPIIPDDLESVLSGCVDGAMVMQYYISKKSFDEKYRNLLADVIVSHEISDDYNKSFPEDRVNMWSKQIITLFPTENLVIWTGETSTSRELAAGRGKLLYRYYNRRRRMRESQLIRNNKRTPNEENNNSFDQDLPEDSENEGNDESIQWLCQNKEPWDEVEHHWKETSKRRMKELLTENTPIHSYMDKFQALRTSFGYMLLEIDFGILYPDSILSFNLEWPTLSAFIIQHLSDKEKRAIDDCVTVGGKKLKTLMSLNNLFSVVSVRRNRKQFRPSRKESVESFILMTKTPADIQPAINARKARYAELALPYSAQAVVVGRNEDNITHSYVRINDVSYEVESPIKAVDVTFKAIHALDAEYPVECSREMFFLQRAVYKILTPADTTKANTKIYDLRTKSLITEYEGLKNT